MGTNDDKPLLNENPENLSRTLTRNQAEQVSRALAEIATALSRLTSALAGEGCFAPQSSLPAGVASPIVPLHAADAVTVSQLVNEFLRAKARAGRSDRYLRALKNSLSKFNHGRAHRALAEITCHEIEKWMQGGQWKPRTQHGYLSDVRVMLNFAVKRGYLVRNPAAAVEAPVFEEAPPSIHTPEQAKKVLEFARGYNLDICRSLAVRYFCGLRSSEVQQLEDNEIGAKRIEVTAAKSKTRRRRLVTIQPNLRLWLDLGGVLPLRDVNGRMRYFVDALAEKTGIVWTHNVTRHSFVSYHLAKWKNAGKTALEAGHTEQMLFAHYRELVTPESAREFWAIVPDSLSG